MEHLSLSHALTDLIHHNALTSTRGDEFVHKSTILSYRPTMNFFYTLPLYGDLNVGYYMNYILKPYAPNAHTQPTHNH